MKGKMARKVIEIPDLILYSDLGDKLEITRDKNKVKFQAIIDYCGNTFEVKIDKLKRVLR